MKNFILTFLLSLLLSVSSYAATDTIEGTAQSTIDTIEGSQGYDTIEGSGAVGGGPDYTDCSELGSYEFAWFGDHASGFSYACKSGGSFVATTTTGTQVTTSSNPGYESPLSGGDGILIDASPEMIQWTTGVDFIGTTEGLLKSSIYFAANTSDNYGMRIYYSSSDQFYCHTRTGGAIRCTHKGSSGLGTSVDCTSTDTINVAGGNWNTIIASFDSTLDEISISINGSTTNMPCSGSMDDFATAPNRIDIYGAIAPDSVYYDNYFYDSESGL